MAKSKTPALNTYIPSLSHTGGNNFMLMAGPCVVEGRDMALNIAEVIKSLSDRHRIPYVFKASYRKANRSRLDSFTGIGDEKALEILAEIREQFSIPVVTDVHSPEEFLEFLKVDLYQDEIFVFTPGGDVKRLPTGATPIDFAFSVHTEVGLRCQGAKVNGRIAPLHRAPLHCPSV